MLTWNLVDVVWSSIAWKYSKCKYIKFKKYSIWVNKIFYIPPLINGLIVLALTNRVSGFQRCRADIKAESLCRYIELINGLRALLISDFSGTDGKGGSENGEDIQEREDEEEEEEGEDDGDSGEGSEEDEEDNEEEEQDSDFDELDEENTAKKKRGCSEKQVSDSFNNSNRTVL